MKDHVSFKSETSLDSKGNTRPGREKPAESNLDQDPSKLTTFPIPGSTNKDSNIPRLVPFKDTATSGGYDASIDAPRSRTAVFHLPPATTAAYLKSASSPQKYWMPDHICKVCYDCLAAFTFFKRRHHCRLCGQIFCSPCSSNWVDGKMYDFDNLIRVCNFCYDKVQENIDLTTSPTSSPTMKNNNGITTSSSPLPLSPSPVAFKTPIDSAASEPQEKADQALSFFPVIQHPDVKHDGTGGQSSVSVSRPPVEDKKGKSKGRQQSIELKYVLEQQRPSNLPQPCTNVEGYTSQIDQTLKIKAHRYIRKIVQYFLNQSSFARDQRDDFEAQIYEMAVTAACTIDPAALQYHHHHASHSSAFFSTDIRDFVKLKSTVGDPKYSITYLNGVVCRKNVAHKKMQRNIEQPRIVLLGGGIDFERNAASRLSSLDTLLEQEKDYMVILVQKLLQLKPSILFVHKSVSRQAQELFGQYQVVLIIHTKMELMQRISRQTGAIILPSIEHVTQLGEKCIGKCEEFRLESVPVSAVRPPTAIVKAVDTSTQDESLPTLMNDTTDTSPPKSSTKMETYLFLDGCFPSTGCSIYFKGPNKAILRELKQVFRQVLYIAYNVYLETSVLKDLCLVPSSQMQWEIDPDPGCDSTSATLADMDTFATRNINITTNDQKEETLSPNYSVTWTKLWLHTNMNAAISTESSSSSNEQYTQCAPPLHENVSFYSPQDQTLGNYLLDTCLSYRSQCKNAKCHDGSFGQHIQTFYFDHVRILVGIEELSRPDVLLEQYHSQEQQQEPLDSLILIFRVCTTCRTSSRLRPISSWTFKYSMAKFLTLFVPEALQSSQKHHNNPSEWSCTHNEFQKVFFSVKGHMIRFECQPAQPWNIRINHLSLPFHPQLYFLQCQEQAQHLKEIAQEVFQAFVHQSKTIAMDLQQEQEKLVQPSSSLSRAMVEFSIAEQHIQTAESLFHERIQSFVDKMTSFSTVDDKVSIIPNESVARLQRQLVLSCHQWNSAFSRIYDGCHTHQNKEKKGIPVSKSSESIENSIPNSSSSPQCIIPDETGTVPSRNSSSSSSSILSPTRLDYYVEGHSTHPTSPEEAEEMAPLSIQPEVVASQSIWRAAFDDIVRVLAGTSTQNPYEVKIPPELLAGHLTLPPGVQDQVTLIYETEPSSIITYSLKSKVYLMELYHTVAKILAQDEIEIVGEDDDPVEVEPTAALQNHLERQIQKHALRIALSTAKVHIKHKFSDITDDKQHTTGFTLTEQNMPALDPGRIPSGCCKMSCTSFFAPQFEALRKLYYSSSSSDEFAFLHSLSIGASRWSTTGGKSGAMFSKTFDERFILKYISRTELESFVDELALDYFGHLVKLQTLRTPSLLAKVLGLYQVSYVNTTTGSKFMSNVAIMENVFYDRKSIVDTYDLKGSLRSRFVGKTSTASTSTTNQGGIHHHHHPSSSSSSSQEPPFESGEELPPEIISSSVVKQDMNYLQWTRGHPIPIHARDYRAFAQATARDVAFLQKVHVIDYSLLIGFSTNHNDVEHELSLGMIDYMRQFDMYKKMESVGKSVTMIAGSAAPTIIRPEAYGKRFQTALECYFVPVPDSQDQTTTETDATTDIQLGFSRTL